MFVYTATKLACGWGRGSDEKANPRPSYWEGVVMQKPLVNAKKLMVMDGRMDGQMDRWTAGRTDGRRDGRNGQMEKRNDRHSGL